jgi:hypothetical protein
MPEANGRPADTLQLKRDEDFTSLYANNVQFEISVWDLKMIFGQLDQSAGMVVEQHTAMTLPWPQAKLAAYFMVVNMIIHQSQMEAPIQLHASAIPKRPDPSDPGVDEANQKLVEYLGWIHDQFFGPNPFLPPGLEPPEHASGRSGS